jgi:hypothetical protein|tara:strand:- start:1631 stop:2389 length:759 start_codon:yes stop_codon:yes gene_type:complete
MPQSDRGKIELFNDFFTGIDISGVADNSTTRTFYNLGDFRLFGDGISEIDSGALAIGSDELSGVVRLTTTNEDKHGAVLGTELAFNVGLMGPIVVEARVRFNNLDTKDAFIGLSDTVGDDLAFEDDMITGASTTLTLTASDLVGFYLCAELTDDEDWHGVYKGGSTTGETTSTSVDLDDDAVAGEFQVLRLEVDTNGTARWYIDGTLKQTVVGAVSTSTDVGVVCGVQAKGAAIEEMDVDYLLVQANRDWTA